MTRLEHSSTDGKRQVAGQRSPSTTNQPTSLGPVDPSWLAKLSGQLGIQPARTVAPLLMSIWPGVHAAAICCREACAYLMQADLHHVSMPQLESNVRAAFRQRGVSVHPSLSIRSEIEADSHFVKEQGANGGDLMVRLDKTSLPAPAVASLYLNGTGARMLAPERALYQAAMHLTWPRALSDDDEYLCCQISELLLEDIERVGIDRNLPRHAMHLTEVGGALRQRSEFDPRLAVIFPKGQVAKSRRPRLSEFLGKEDLKPFFRVVESRLRQSEKVVTLRTDVLLRSLGPMASVLQKSLSPALKDTSQLPCEPSRGLTEQLYPTHTPSYPLPIPNTSDKTRPKGRRGDALGDTMSPATGRDSCWSYSGRSVDPLQSRLESASKSFTRAQSLFMGLESASEVPIEIRNCWSTIEDDTLPDDALANGGRSYPGNFASSHRPSYGPPGPRGEGQEDDSSENALLAVVPPRAEDQTGGSSGAGTGKPATEPSEVGFFSFGSEEMSDAGGTAAADSSGPEGIRGVSNSATSLSGAARPWAPASGAASTTGSTACWNKSSDPHQSPLVSVGLSGLAGGAGGSGPIHEPRGGGLPLDARSLQSSDRNTRLSLGANAEENASVWEKSSMWGTPGGTRGDPWHCRSHGTVLECLPSHMRGSNTGSQIDDAAGRSMWGSPACLVQGSDSDPVHVQQHPQALNGAGTANYAAALRSATQPGNSVNANSRPHSPTGAAALTNDAIYAHLDTCGREVHSLLPPTVIDAVCDAVRRAAPRLNAPALLQVSMGMPSTVSATMPGGALGPVDVATEFLACVNAAALSRTQVASMLERASDSAKRALVISGLPPGTLPSSTVAQTLPALKPMVRREVVALVDAHPGALRFSHFDEGVMCHLQRRPEALVAAALREIARRTDLPGASNKSAYLTHWLMRFADDPAIPNLASKCAGKGGSSSCPDLRRLPRSVQSSVERLVDSSPWIDWRHFDAGVMKVLQQLASASESDAVSELRQVEVTELSSVKNMPAYLNKCFNNRLWKVRES